MYTLLRKVHSVLFYLKHGGVRQPLYLFWGLTHIFFQIAYLYSLLLILLILIICTFNCMSQFAKWGKWCLYDVIAQLFCIPVSLFIGCLMWTLIPGSHARGSHWIPAGMTNKRQHMHSHDWLVTAYIKQSPLLLREKASASVTTLIERVRCFLVEPSYLYKSMGTLFT